ncbi:MAG: hypothetical protein GVY13_12925 [Alphaproteobacteria bacterium]|jgi:sugar phosphate permease|nr:hypothetical protein [Alphaproteobacteria bacterium]
MGNIGNWVMGGVIGFLGLLGLFMASRAEDDMFYFAGILLFVFAIFFVFRLIGKYTAQKTVTTDH